MKTANVNFNKPNVNNIYFFNFRHSKLWLTLSTD